MEKLYIKDCMREIIEFAILALAFICIFSCSKSYIVDINERMLPPATKAMAKPDTTKQEEPDTTKQEEPDTMKTPISFEVNVENWSNEN